ncbi:MAG: hypothetical protein PHV75_06455 [Victivallaceae bacterium]|nr:hypothetical protein [Victivallaceae bacterium]NLK83986.1 hypothetical protein [Lentisphaerota bacterium]MDD3115981.1 hypothetical protein [Victivallaceae bacterium]MDD3704246.1 hypothetical protein [Victivallaceae bacterium]MDD4318141.1 hypothetical protein [Victivallaceae bacterium]
MKIILFLLLIAGLIYGCTWAYKNFIKTPENQPAAYQSTETEKAAEPVSQETPAVQNLSTAQTPVAKSKIGKKINTIYSDHNRGVENAAAQ